MGVIPWSPLAGGTLSGRHRRGVTPEPSHRQRLWERRGMGRSGPAEELKRTAAEDLSELADKFGLTMIELALAFVINHPAVTSAIIGPRTMEHLESQLTAPDLSLPEELLDAIDEIVPPSITLNPADGGWTPPSLEPRNRRR
jgi:aryl-alcohol dehydrogenase-like predicted oxidoreductase